MRFDLTTDRISIDKVVHETQVYCYQALADKTK
jgi:hypothetical protein